MERLSCECVILSCVDYGDADRVVTLFSRERGKLSAFAAGARKSKRRFAGALEPFTLVQAQLVERRGDTFRLDGTDIQKTYFHIRQELPLIARALYAVELCRELLRDGQPHPQLFELLSDYLGQLEAKAAGPSSLIAFELSALAHAGFMPRFSPCSLCGGALGEKTLFDAEHGGAVCEACSPRAQFGLPVSSRVLQALDALQAGVRTPVPADIRKRSRQLLNAFIAHHLGRKLKSVEFMDQVGLD
ncbi:MAG: DNA repair protein RecO [Myxococcaceae bacterium]